MEQKIMKYIELLGNSFLKVLYEPDQTFLEGMEKLGVDAKEISKYKFWEWTQGVGLYGFWKMFELTNNEKYLDILVKYYDDRIEEGLPGKNINTVAPMLTMACLYEYNKDERYLPIIKEWSTWIMESLTKTKEGGFQHITSDTENKGELWDDTLFMTVLFLAKAGLILENDVYVEESKYQFLLHIKYLADKKTGLWYHGWTFEGSHNFVEALWGRGNSWITIAIPEFLEMVDVKGTAVERFLINAFERQVEALKEYQNKNGMWHTLVNDSTSYVESSATAAFAAGILKGVHMGIISGDYREVALKAVDPLLEQVDAKGVVHQVSYGTAMGRKSLQFYKDIELMPMPYGQALLMLLLIEMLKEEKNN